MTLRIAFMGTPAFAVVALQALHAAGHDIAAVYCQPAKPSGRGQNVHKSHVQQAAEELNLEVRSPVSLKDPDEQNKFDHLKLDVAVVAAYGLILPKRILSMPKFGCLNIHASLLPRWRGAAPIQRAILAGDTETGITIMQMDVGLDTGAILLQDHMGINAHTTSTRLHDDLGKMGAHLIVEALSKLETGKITAKAQPEMGAVYAQKLSREDGKIDWTKSASYIEQQVRALNPWPGCFFSLNGESVKLLSVAFEPTKSGLAGVILDDDFSVACGEGVLRLTSVQRPGKNVTDGASLLRGLRLPVGSKL